MLGSIESHSVLMASKSLSRYIRPYQDLSQGRKQTEREVRSKEWFGAFFGDEQSSRDLKPFSRRTVDTGS
jgi:hypothetical protein